MTTPTDHAGHVKVLRAVRSVFEHIPAPCTERDALDAAIALQSAPRGVGVDAVENLRAVLCDSEGRCCIAGSDEDRAIVDRSLFALTAALAGGGEGVRWPERMVNLPCPDGTTDRIVGFRIPEGDPILGDYGLSEPLAWLRSVTIERLAGSATAGGDDTKRLNWLAKQCGVNLVSDDGGKWAISTSGFQPVPQEGGFTEDVSITSFVGPEEWRDDIRAAFDAAIAEEQADDEAAPPAEGVQG